jgi:putative ABC transport system permease protein
MGVDFLHLLRNLRRSPGSAIAAILTLSLTIGAGASIFAVVDAVLLTPPPFSNPDALVILRETTIDDPASVPRRASYATFEAWRERAGSLSQIEAQDGTNFTLTELGPAERLSGTNVTPGFLTLLGVRPELGRGFEADDVGRPVAIVSHAFWRAKLSGDPGVIGRQIMLGSRPHTIVGVLPERFLFFGQNRCDVWRPFPVTPAQAVRAGYQVGVVARLAPHVSATDLEQALGAVSRRSLPAARPVATPLAVAMAGGARETLVVLAGAAAVALLLAFINLAGLLIVRSIDRRRELAVRSALGARNLEIARQLLLEAATIVSIGTVGGVLLALWLTPVVGRLALEQFGGIAVRGVAVSWRVIAFVSIVAAACAAVCGSLPAVIATRRNVVDVLRRGLTPAPRERALRRVFVAGEIALAFVLLVSMTLLGRSLFSVLRIDPGFDAHGLVVLNVSLPGESYSGERVVSFYSALQSALEQRLGPGTTAIVDEIPLTGNRTPSQVSVRPGEAGQGAVIRAAATPYFDVMRIPLLAGRSFDGGDNSSAPLRAVASRSLTQRLFAIDQPIGRQVWIPALAQSVEIVGIVGEVKHNALDEAMLPTLYLSPLQVPSNSNVVVVRSERPDADVTAVVREEVARLDGNIPVYSSRSMEEIVRSSPGVPARRVVTAAFTAFAALALILGALGLFGAAAHDVAARRAELALRIALGADPTRILTATIAQGALVTGSGLAAGAVMSVWASAGLGGLVRATGHLDLLSVTAPAVLVMAVGIAAIIPAALRAARTDPLSTLRAD